MPSSRKQRAASSKKSRRRRASRDKRQVKLQNKINLATKLADLQWRDLAPHGRRERDKMPDQCFLVKHPDRRYPTCPTRTNSVTCKGIKAARERAVLNMEEDIVHLADRAAQQHLCSSQAAQERDVHVIARSLKRRSRGNTKRRQRRSSRRAATGKKVAPPQFSSSHLANIVYNIPTKTEKSPSTRRASRDI